jgi:transcriptional regulator with XRE-family HTH domain
VTKSVAEVAGERARALRLDAHKSLEDVATAARSYGLRWSTGSVSDFESGRATPSLPTLLVVAAALGDVIGRRVSLTDDLFGGDGFVVINDKLGSIALDKLRVILFGKAVRLTPVKRAPSPTARRRAKAAAALISGPADAVGVLQEFRESDMRMCKNIGVSLDVGATAMAELWQSGRWTGRTFVEERDHRAGPDANAQRRGQISRQLKAELQKVIG